MTKPHLRLVTDGEPAETKAPSGYRSPAEVLAEGPEAIFNEYANYVGSIALKMTGSPSDVEDLVQETFAIAFQRLHQLKEPAALKVWLARICANKAKRWMTKQKVRRWVPLMDAPEAEWDGPSQSDELAVRELYDALKTLPNQQRIVWTLRQVERATVPEIAQICEISESTVKREFNRADATLKEIFDDQQ